MTRSDALEFWEEFLFMSSGANAGASIPNPAVVFTKTAQAGTYDSLSEEEFQALSARVEEFSYFWRNQPSAKARDILSYAIQATDVPKPVLHEIASRLADCSAATRYGSPWMLPGGNYPFLEDDDLPGLVRHYGPFGDACGVSCAPGPATPREICDGLLRDVYHQDEACRAAAVIMYKHLNGQRTNALFQGPTGTGKSEIWRSMGRLFPGRVRLVDFSRVTGDGWSGSMHMRDVFDGVDPSLLSGEGIVLVLDEADKIVGETAVGAGGTNYNGIVQNHLLKLLDGDVVEFGRERDREPLTVDCSHVSVVLLGAFENLVSARAAGSKRIGFGSSSAAAKDESAPVGYGELVRSGMRRELAGRVQRIVQLRALDQSDYESILRGRILHDPRVTGGMAASMDDGSVRALAAEAMSSELGVRWMSSQVANAVDVLTFDHPDAVKCSIKYPPCVAEPVEDGPARKRRCGNAVKRDPAVKRERAAEASAQGCD